VRSKSKITEENLRDTQGKATAKDWNKNPSSRDRRDMQDCRQSSYSRTGHMILISFWVKI